MPKTQSNLRLFQKNYLVATQNTRNKGFYKKNLLVEDQQRNPLLFKQKIIRKLRQGYTSKLKNSSKQWKLKFRSFIKLKLQNYEENCSSSCQFICPICLQMYMTPCPTSCGHIFCFRCIDQSIIRNSNCPTCRNFIRTDQFIQSKAFSELNNKFWLSSKQKDEYQEKFLKNQQWLKARLIDKDNIKVNDLIDVKDTEHIWCKANVLNIYKGADRTQILVHFEGWNQIYNEVININSQRLAPRNFFSERQDIPRYRLSSPQDNMRSRIEYRDYRDRNINFSLNPNENQIESQEDTNNNSLNLINQRNPLTIRLNQRSGRNSIFAIRNLIQPYILRNLRPQNHQSISENQEVSEVSQNVESNSEESEMVQEEQSGQQSQSSQSSQSNQSRQQGQLEQQQISREEQRRILQQQINQIEGRRDYLMQRTDPEARQRLQSERRQYLGNLQIQQEYNQQNENAIEVRNQYQNNLSISNNSLELIDDYYLINNSYENDEQNIFQNRQDESLRSVSQYINQNDNQIEDESIQLIDGNNMNPHRNSNQLPIQYPKGSDAENQIEIKQIINQNITKINQQEVHLSEGTKSLQKKSRSKKKKVTQSQNNLIQEGQSENFDENYSNKS